MYPQSSTILSTLLDALLETEEHPEANDCIGFVADFLKSIDNGSILSACSIRWDDTNKGYLLLWDEVLPNYLFKADILICKDYYSYNFIIRDRDGHYLGSDGTSGKIEDYYEYDWDTGERRSVKGRPFWRDIVNHLEEVYGS